MHKTNDGWYTYFLDADAFSEKFWPTQEKDALPRVYTMLEQLLGSVSPVPSMVGVVPSMVGVVPSMVGVVPRASRMVMGSGPGCSWVTHKLSLFRRFFCRLGRHIRVTFSVHQFRVFPLAWIVV